MKRLAVIISVAILWCVLLPAALAEAAGSPHVVVDGDVWLYDADGNKLFLLPDSYYARINNLDENYYYVTFNGIAGKVSKNEVSTVGYHTLAQGTMQEIHIAEAYSEFTAINLKCAPDIGAENSATVPMNATVTFLGTYPVESELWYYVKYEQYLGYIRAERTSMPEPKIPDFIPEKEPEDSPTVAPNDNDEKSEVISALESKELQIVIIVGLAIPSVAIVILLFRPAKKKEKYYNEE